MKLLIGVVLSAIFFLHTAGCTIYKAAVDERDVGTIVSDTKIKAAIVADFIDDENIKALDITVSCYNGHVYLIGEIEKTVQKEKAKRIAGSKEGVKDVTTYLVPKLTTEGCGMTDNTAMTAKVKAALVKDSSIWSTNVDVKTIQCKTVVLWGLVGRKLEVEKAITHAKEIAVDYEIKSFLKATQID